MVQFNFLQSGRVVSVSLIEGRDRVLRYVDKDGSVCVETFRLQDGAVHRHMQTEVGDEVITGQFVCPVEDLASLPSGGVMIPDWQSDMAMA